MEEEEDEGEQEEEEGWVAFESDEDEEGGEAKPEGEGEAKPEGEGEAKPEGEGETKPEGTVEDGTTAEIKPEETKPEETETKPAEEAKPDEGKEEAKPEGVEGEEPKEKEVKISDIVEEVEFVPDEPIVQAEAYSRPEPVVDERYLRADELYVSKRRRQQPQRDTRRKPKYHITDHRLKNSLYFVNKLHNMTIAPGKTITMQSIISSIDPIRTEWRRNGRLLSETPRTEMFFNKRTNVASIEIRKCRLQDNGKYTCIAISDLCGEVEDECEITVEKPKIETADQPPTFTRLITGIRFYKCLNLNKKYFGTKP